MSTEMLDTLAEIRRLLFEAYDHYFATADGHCKSGEGEVSLHFPNYFEVRDRGRVEPSVAIYSYVLGPSRHHYFGSLAEALVAVREWHREEMQLEADD